MNKTQVHKHCVQLVEDKIDRLNGLIKSAQDAANDDTKSSAEDKYETNREMMNAEKDKAKRQLDEAYKLRKVLDVINPNLGSETVDLGALIQTNIGWFYYAVGLGQLQVGTNKVFGISPVSPLGTILRDAKVGDNFSFNGREVKVELVS